MSYVQVKCPECGEFVMIYPREDRKYKSGEELGRNGCLSCGSRVEAIISVRITKKEE